MTARHDLDRVLTAWLTDELGPVEAPSYFGDTLDLIDRTPQRRARPWGGLAIPRRWTRIDLPAGAWAALVVTLLLLAIVVAALIGAIDLRPPPVPTGPGRILITSGGDVTVVNPDGGSQKLSETPVDETMSSWSADGTRVAYWTWRVEAKPDGSEDVWVSLTVMNADGTERVELLDGLDPPIPTIEGRPEWSPDGRYLVFSLDGTIYRLAADGSGLTTIADDGRLARSLPTWSPDGQWIAFLAGPVEPDPDQPPELAVHVVRPDGSGETVASADTGVWTGTFGPAWSADSRRLAYTTAGDGNVADDIEIAILDGTGWTQARAPDAGIESMAGLQWSPHAARLAYMRALPEPTPEGFSALQLTLIEADLTVRPITEEPLSLGFCWSPDGTRIAAVTNDQHLVEIDVATGRRLRDFGVAEVNVGDSCVWSAWAGEPPPT